jgi:hypothetical protein
MLLSGPCGSQVPGMGRALSTADRPTSSQQQPSSSTSASQQPQQGDTPPEGSDPGASTSTSGTGGGSGSGSGFGADRTFQGFRESMGKFTENLRGGGSSDGEAPPLNERAASLWASVVKDVKAAGTWLCGHMLRGVGRGLQLCVGKARAVAVGAVRDFTAAELKRAAMPLSSVVVCQCAQRHCG